MEENHISKKRYLKRKPSPVRRRNPPEGTPPFAPGPTGSEPELTGAEPAAGEAAAEAANAAASETDLAARRRELEEYHKRLEWLIAYLERSRLNEYMYFMNRPSLIIRVNLLAGIARGLGIAVGFTILGALAVFLLQRMAILNLPLVGDFITKLLEYIEMNRDVRI